MTKKINNTLISSRDIIERSNELSEEKKEILLSYFNKKSKESSRMSFSHLLVRANCQILLDNPNDTALWNKLKEL